MASSKDLDQLFSEILDKAVVKGENYVTDLSRTAFRWHREKVKRLNQDNLLQDRDLIKDPDRQDNNFFVGSMYLFKYKPLHRDALPYYDEYPLVIPIIDNSSGTSFLGLNLHYLPPILRATFFDKLTDLKNNDKYDETTKIILTYDLLKSISKLKAFKPTLKRYRLDHVKSKFIMIQPIEWNVALFLPTEKFRGANKSEVWKDSRRKI